MSTTLMALGLYKSAQISLPLLKAGFKILRDHALSAGKESEWEKGVQDLLGDQVKELLKGRIDKLSPKQLEAAEAPLVSFAGLVLQSLVQDVLNTEDFASVKAEFTAALAELPQRWKTFVGQGISEAQPLNNADFLAALQAAHNGDDSSSAIPPEWLASFFSQWIQRDIGLTRQREGWHTSLATAVAPLIGEALSSTLVSAHPAAATAFRDSMLRFHTELRSLVKEVIIEVKNQGAQSAERDNKLEEMMLKIAANQQISNKESRLAAYKRSLLSAFRPYQELAIDNFAAGEQAAPDIWDIFVHPACSKEHLRPEDMDAAQREIPQRLPAQDLLPLLAQDDHRRTVLLADPGMGKSTLIQSLIAHLSSGRSFTGAAAFTGLLPVPLILRDLVPLLPQDQVESWSWDGLLTILIEHYRRDETAPPLCDGFKDHCDEFRQLIHTDKTVFFLIDGLDEIGDLFKRRQIVKCIQDGIRVTNKEARWLITSRVIGYEDAPAEHILINALQSFGEDRYYETWNEEETFINIKLSAHNLAAHMEKWSQYVLPEEQLSWDSHRQGIIDLQKELKQRPWTQVSGERRSLERSIFVHDRRSLIANIRDLAVYCVRTPIAQRIHLAPFDDKRQDSFTQRWFQHRHSTDHSRELMREVRVHHHDGVRIISRVPNLLCMMNILKRSGKPLPDGRAALYDAIVQAYLSGIDAAYRLRPVLGNTCPFDAGQRRFLLSLLGAHMQQTRVTASGEQSADIKESIKKPTAESEGNILISRLELEQLLSPAIQRMQKERRLVSNHTTAELLDELLHHISSRSGLLIPRSIDASGHTLYSFTHLSFLEFFAAEWLGMEFDRGRNRIVRRTLALEEGQTLTETELDSEFPPHGAVHYTRESFRDLPAIPAWHEPLIFLLESRKADTLTLLRWLFPALHPAKLPTDADFRRSTFDIPHSNTPLLPLDAVRLAIQLAHDQEIPLPVPTRQCWWRILWSSYLAWPYLPWNHDESKRWPIAPLLLGPATDHTEVLQALVEIYPQAASHRKPPPLYLNDCIHLTSQHHLPLTGLTELEHLGLEGCTGLERLPDLSASQRLKRVKLSRCTGLQGAKALNGLAGLVELEGLWLNDCTGLTAADVAELRRTLQKGCKIWGPDGEWVK